jgi:hypothetical protein
MTDALAKDAARRSKRALQDVKRTVAAMETSGIKISLRAVATEAGVSRNYIYTTPEALECVKAARGRSQKNRVRILPREVSQHGGSDESIRMRLAAALTQVDALMSEVRLLSETNNELIAEVIKLQNPLPENVAPIRKRRS